MKKRTTFYTSPIGLALLSFFLLFLTQPSPAALAQPGKITIVDYYADWCGPCRQIAPMLQRLARSDHAIALRRINIVSFNSAIARRANIHSIPLILIYDRNGRLVGKVDGANPNQVMNYVALAKKRG